MSNLGGNSPSQDTDRSNNINGDDGDTPFINGSGNWQIGATDTGVKAEGQNGTDGIMASVVAGVGTSVDATDPSNPIVSSTDIAVAVFASGLLADSDKILTHVVTVAFDLESSLTSSEAYAEVTATAAATVDILKNAVSIGSVNFALGANTATFTFTTTTAFAIGDRLSLVGQAVADATLSDVSINLRGVLS